MQVICYGIHLVHIQTAESSDVLYTRKKKNGIIRVIKKINGQLLKSMAMTLSGLTSTVYILSLYRTFSAR